MYLDYESFVDCLINSGFKKTYSDLTTEFWDGFDYWVELTHNEDYKYVVKVDSGSIIHVEKAED